MDTLDNVTIGMTATKAVRVSYAMTVDHFVANMPQVYATPMMILHMEMASGSAIASHLPEGFVSVGMDVKVRHLAATPEGRTVRAIARVIQIDGKSVLFEVEAWDGDRKIGDGTHRRGIVNFVEFEKRFGVKRLTMSLDWSNPDNASRSGPRSLPHPATTR
ncbi:MAG: thioesterase [Bradyrhizobium sp.]|uniref:thioesterase family protein n=1 Tax=Bradyrhizobium sp. TaxID=376 RepID=UPI0011FB2759|nr:MAG: thioesterase [Bradyrhizobium sp.]